MITLTIHLPDDQHAALRKLMEHLPETVTEEQMAQALFKDHLISLGVLPLGGKNRSRWAKRGRRSSGPRTGSRSAPPGP